MDKENELWKYAAVRPKSHNNSILSFLAPRTGALAKAIWITTLREQCSGTLLLPSPITDITPLPHSTASVMLCTATRASRSATGAANGTGPDGCLPELDMFPLLQVCVYGICAFVLRCFFFCSQTVLQTEHSLGVKKKIFLLSLLSTLTVRPVFGNQTSFLYAMVVVRRAGLCQNKDFPTGLWTLSWLHIRAKVRNALCTLGPTQRGL